jgi:DNA-binding NtrC family response regulator
MRDKPADRGRLLRIIHLAVAGVDTARPRMLYVEPDGDLRHLVREALRAQAEVISVGSVDDARRALATLDLDLDLAVLDLAPMHEAGLDLLSELHNHDGQPIPALLFSTDDPALATGVSTALAKARMSIERMVTTIQRAVARHSQSEHRKIEVA